MGAVGLLAGSEIRHRWRSTIAIALLVGVVGAVVLATAAGARRSDTALDRFNAQSRTSDLELSVGERTSSQLAEFRKTPGILALAHLRSFAFGFEQLKGLALAAPVDGAMGHLVDRSRLIAGRRPDPSVAEEITIGESLADTAHLGLGDHYETSSYTPQQVVTAFSGGNPGIPAGPRMRFRIVGIDRRPLDLGVRAESGGVVILAPAFARKYGDQIGVYTDVLRVRTKAGQADVPHVGAAARRLFGKDQTFGSQSLGIETEGARNAINVLTLALWIIAGVTALAGLVAIAIVLTRDISHADLDQETLRAVGLTRRQRIALNGPRVLIIAGGGALVAGLGAVGLSRFFPVGVARRADPSPGLHADWTVLALAIPILVAIVAGIALFAAWRATRRSPLDRTTHEYRRTSNIVEQAAAAGMRPTFVNGFRMAIQSGRGATAVPVRSAFAGAIFGVAGVTAALVFAASLTHLVATPHLYGWTFEVKAEVGTNRVCGDRNPHGMGKVPAVESLAVVCPTGLEIDGRPVTVWGFLPIRGTIDPEVVSGRAPRGRHEIALGAVTLSALHKHIGDTVRVRGHGATQKYVIVGRIVLPTIGDAQTLADGGSVTGASFASLYDTGENETDFLVAHLERGADRASVKRRFSTIPQVQNVGVPTVPVEVDRLQKIDRIPATVAALLGVLALLAVGHALVTAVRRRRGELALLKVLGFDRGQVRATVAWQATTLGVVGLVLGIPIGIIVGRLGWQLVADSLGVSAEVATPALWLVLSVPIVLVLVNLIAYFPGRSAARTRPAVALRSA